MEISTQFLVESYVRRTSFLSCRQRFLVCTKKEGCGSSPIKEKDGSFIKLEEG